MKLDPKTIELTLNDRFALRDALTIAEHIVGRKLNRLDPEGATYEKTVDQLCAFRDLNQRLSDI